MNTTTPRIEEKNVRHQFTNAELLAMGKALSQALDRVRLTEGEFEQVKSSFKARITEAESTAQTLSSEIGAGFTFRKKRCRVVYRPDDRKKDYWPEDVPDAEGPALTEDMTQDDFQRDLIQAESKFELREEIEIFPPAGADRGVIAVGRLNGRWFTALRMQIGTHKIDQRLDSEQRSAKTRPEAVKRGAVAAAEWITASIGDDKAAGFAPHFEKIKREHAERVE